MSQGARTDEPKPVLFFPPLRLPRPPAYKRHVVDHKTKRPKPRLTTDKSGPRETTTSDGQSIADNDNIDLEDHPPTRLPRVGELRQALETLGGIVRAIAPEVRSAAPSAEAADRAMEALQIDMGSDDFQAYFNQVGRLIPRFTHRPSYDQCASVPPRSLPSLTRRSPAPEPVRC